MIHSSALVDPEAIIGENVIVDAFAVVEKNVVIGDNTRIFSHAVILSGARIGKNCKVFPGAVIAGIPQDLKFKGEETTAEIGDNTTVRECVTVNRGTASKAKTTVGNNCLLMAYCHIAHDCVIHDNVIIGNASQLAGEIEVDGWAIVSGGTLVHQFCHIGAHVMIQGGSKIGKDIPPYITVGREPLSYAGLNVVGLRRRGFTNEQISLCQEMYRVIYQSGLNNTAAIKQIEIDFPKSIEKDTVISFVKNSQRGIIRGNLMD
ncbi:MAG: acyl-ACP--UDP-N-acetylglucosamine O-acyltransferase [Dysgonamonadaceae bacterium]|jgi:UDP-N-acetylglucosamine acyltransferase|nr:acyl-ACP--UDP-N-acetylglucosamine O-acyltransferase [Dysgonamonadaceae bacterium]